MKQKIMQTADGSHTLYVPEMNEQYHSRFGAITESRHIYIQNGIHACKLKNISLFELGFGTGLNAFLSLLEAELFKLKIEYTAIELHPLSSELIYSLNYPLLLDSAYKSHFLRLHESAWNEYITLTGSFTFRKILYDITKYTFDRMYDLVYFDAFSPSVQPELWTQKIFNKIYDQMNSEGIFVTYSSMGEVKRRLIAAGFQVKKIPGPPGKRQILQALKS